MLPGLKLVEQRDQAVLGVLEGATVSSVAHRSQVGRRTLPVWLGRDAVYGRAGPAGKSSRPLSCAYQIRPEVEARIVAMRREHPGWGPGTALYWLELTVLYWLELEGLQQLSRRTSMERRLARHQTGA